jgi:methionyl-tRNA formyltransferase
MRIVFMGTPQAAVPSLARCLEDGHDVVAVWTQPDRPSGRGRKLTASEVKQFALAHDLNLEQPTRIKTEEAKHLFASYNADVAVVVAYGRILPAEFLRAPHRGCINVHFSLLPHYRGAAPVNWAIVNGEDQTGVTTMFIEEELDSGPILLQRKMPIGASETAPELMSRLAGSGAELLSETLQRLNEITPIPQRDREATFAPLLTRDDGIIDWSKSADTIECAIRGFQPWPNAHTRYRGQRLIIWKAEPVTATDAGGESGEVIATGSNDLLVKCGERTALRILELQPEAKRRMTAREFLNGTHLKIGDRFGEV